MGPLFFWPKLDGTDTTVLFALISKIELTRKPPYESELASEDHMACDDTKIG